MRVFTLKSETSLAAVADRLFANLTPESRRTAEAALLKANPQFARGEAFKPGALVRLPEIPELKVKTGVVAKDPRDGLIDDLGVAVADYRARLAMGLEAGQKAIEAQQELLKQREVVDLLKKEKGAAELAKALTETLQRNGKALSEDKKRQDQAFVRIAKDLAALAKITLPGQES